MLITVVAVKCSSGIVESWSVNVIVGCWNVTETNLTGSSACDAAFVGISPDDMPVDRRVEVILTTAAVHSQMKSECVCNRVDPICYLV